MKGEKVLVQKSSSVGKVIEAGIEAVLSLLSPADEKIAFSVLVHTLVIVAKTDNIGIDKIKDYIDDAWDIVETKGNCDECENKDSCKNEKAKSKKWN